MTRYLLTLLIYAILLFIGVRVNDQLTYGDGKLTTEPVPVGETRLIAFVANEVDGSVSLIDTKDWSVIHTMNVIPDGKGVSVFRDILQAAVGLKKAEALGTSYIADIALSRDGDTLYVSRTNLADVIAFDLTTGGAFWRRPVAGYVAGDIALNEREDRLFVAAPTVPRIDVVETVNESLARSLLIPGNLVSVGKAKEKDFIIVLYQDAGKLVAQAYDPAHLEAIGEPVALGSRDEFDALTGGRPDLCRIDASNSKIIVAGGVAGGIETGPAPAMAVVTPDQNFCLVTDHQAGEVTVLALGSGGALVSKTEVGQGASRIVIGEVPESVLAGLLGLEVPEEASDAPIVIEPIIPVTSTDETPEPEADADSAADPAETPVDEAAEESPEPQN